MMTLIGTTSIKLVHMHLSIYYTFIHLLRIHQTELLAPDTQYAYDVALLSRLAQE